jgi:hypothetical protein
MKIILSTLKKVLFWSYERGSWQYDVMCVLILVFVLFTPNRIFDRRTSTNPIVVRSAELGQIDGSDREREIEARLRQKYGPTVRIESAVDSSGEISYVIYQK